MPFSMAAICTLAPNMLRRAEYRRMDGDAELEARGMVWVFRMKPKTQCVEGGGSRSNRPGAPPISAPSISSMRSLVETPPGAEKPPDCAPEASTRWQGTMMGKGLCPSACPRRALHQVLPAVPRSRHRFWSCPAGCPARPCTRAGERASRGAGPARKNAGRGPRLRARPPCRLWPAARQAAAFRLPATGTAGAGATACGLRSARAGVRRRCHGRSTPGALADGGGKKREVVEFAVGAHACAPCYAVVRSRGRRRGM